MQIYEETGGPRPDRQFTDEAEIRELINNGEPNSISALTAPPTASPGHFMALTLMKRLQMAGTRPWP